jgi:hypothetical protein
MESTLFFLESIPHETPDQPVPNYDPTLAVTTVKFGEHYFW